MPDKTASGICKIDFHNLGIFFHTGIRSGLARKEPAQRAMATVIYGHDERKAF